MRCSGGEQDVFVPTEYTAIIPNIIHEERTFTLCANSGLGL